MVIELDAGVADAQCFRRPVGDVAAKEKIVLKLLLTDFFGSFVIVIDQLSDGPSVGLLGARALAVELKLPSHLLIPIRLTVVHGCSERTG